MKSLLSARQRDRLLAEEGDGNSFVDPAGEIEGVPIGQTNAAVRVGFANLSRFRRSMNTVAVFAQIDPNNPGGIVWAGTNGHLMPNFHSGKMKTRIIVIGWI